MLLTTKRYCAKRDKLKNSWLRRSLDFSKRRPGLTVILRKSEQDCAENKKRTQGGSKMKKIGY